MNILNKLLKLIGYTKQKDQDEFIKRLQDKTDLLEDSIRNIDNYELVRAKLKKSIPLLSDFELRYFRPKGYKVDKDEVGVYMGYRILLHREKIDFYK